MIRTWFAKGADALVSASALAQRFEGMEKTMADLKQSYEEVVSHNRFLLRQVASMETEAAQVKTERDEAKREVSLFNQRMAERDDTINTLQGDNRGLHETIQRLSKESDDHMMRALKAEEVVDKVKSKLSFLRDTVDDVDAAVGAVEAVVFPPAETFLHTETAPVDAEATHSADALPEGVQVFPLDTTPPEVIHNAIADAVGEPEQKIEEKKEEPSAEPWRYGFAASS